MYFEQGQLYHIFNQGNNKQQIFFTRDNYLYFLSKIKKHLSNNCSILAWCLMPNHFHLMVKIPNYSYSRGDADYSRGDYLRLLDSHPVSERERHPVSKKESHPVSKGIATILRSYTRAINNQNYRTGSLFRGGTKAECITCIDSVSKNWFYNNGITEINIEVPERQYPQICYRYILNNPVAAQLVKRPEDWEYSSARDALGLRDGKLIDRDVIKEYGLVL